MLWCDKVTHKEASRNRQWSRSVLASCKFVSTLLNNNTHRPQNLRYIVIFQIVGAFTVALSSNQTVVLRQCLFSEVSLAFDPDLKGLWDIWYQQVNQTRDEEDEMLRNKSSHANTLLNSQKE